MADMNGFRHIQYTAKWLLNAVIPEQLLDHEVRFPYVISFKPYFFELLYLF